LVFGKRFGQIVLGTHHASTRLVENPVLGRQHDNGYTRKLVVALDDGAGLIPIQTGHQNVTENDVWLVVVDFGQGIEAILGEHDVVPTLLEEYLGTPPDRIAVVNDQYFQVRSIRINKTMFLPNLLLIRTLATQPQNMLLNLDHFKIFLARTALGTGPVHRHIGPQRTRRNTVVRGSQFFVIDPATDQTHPSFCITHSLRGLRIECNDCIDATQTICV